MIKIIIEKENTMLVPIVEHKNYFPIVILSIMILLFLSIVLYASLQCKNNEENCENEVDSEDSVTNDVGGFIAGTSLIAILIAFASYGFLSSKGLSYNSFEVGSNENIDNKVITAVEKAYPGSHVMDHVKATKMVRSEVLHSRLIRNSSGQVQKCDIQLLDTPAEKYLKNGVPAIVMCDTLGVKAELNSNNVANKTTLK